MLQGHNCEERLSNISGGMIKGLSSLPKTGYNRRKAVYSITKASVRSLFALTRDVLGLASCKDTPSCDRALRTAEGGAEYCCAPSDPALCCLYRDLTLAYGEEVTTGIVRVDNKWRLTTRVSRVDKTHRKLWNPHYHAEQGDRGNKEAVTAQSPRL